MATEVSLADLALGGAVVVAGLIALKATQYARPSLYFTTGSFFDKRADVRTPAIGARLTIPALQGAAVALLFNDHSVAIAVVVSVITWLFAIWPAIWNPALLPHSRRKPIWLLMGMFWLGFAVFSALGALWMDVIASVLADDDFDLRKEIVMLFLGAIIGWLIAQAARAADRRVSFADDDPGSVHHEP